MILHKRIEGTPNNFSLSELQGNLSCPFDQYNFSNFKQNAQKVANRVKKIEQKGNGLTKEIKEYLHKVIVNKPEL